MDWQQVVSRLRQIEEYFNRSYKCLNIEKTPKEETLHKHLKILFERFEEIRVLLDSNYARFTKSHQTAAEAYFIDVRRKLITVLTRSGIEVKLPTTLHDTVTYEVINISTEVGHDTALIPNTGTTINMPQSITEFLGLASRLLPDFDGQPENLQSFVDALNLVDSIKDTHEAVAVNVIKTKLKGSARILISDENTIQSIIAKLKTTVRGETVDVVNAKLMNVRQQGKNANTYAKEIEDLTRKLETAYISDGLPTQVASQYATRSAVKAIVKNAANERVRLIMESGTFSNMNEVISKYVGSCTEAFGQPNSILYHHDSHRGNNQHRGRGNNRYKRTRGNGNNNQFNNNGYRGRNYNNNRGGGRGNNHNRNNNRGNNHNVRYVTEDNSENGQQPLT